MTTDEVKKRVRKQIINAIRKDLDGRGESLMKEAYEDVMSDSENPEQEIVNFAVVYDEMRLIIKTIEELP